MGSSLQYLPADMSNSKNSNDHSNHADDSKLIVTLMH